MAGQRSADSSRTRRFYCTCRSAAPALLWPEACVATPATTDQPHEERTTTTTTKGTLIDFGRGARVCLFLAATRAGERRPTRRAHTSLGPERRERPPPSSRIRPTLGRRIRTRTTTTAAYFRWRHSIYYCGGRRRRSRSALTLMFEPTERLFKTTTTTTIQRKLATK